MHPEIKRWFIGHAKVAAVALAILTVFYAVFMMFGVPFSTILLNYAVFLIGSPILSLVVAWVISRDLGITLKEGLFGAEKV